MNVRRNLTFATRRLAFRFRNFYSGVAGPFPQRRTLMRVSIFPAVMLVVRTRTMGECTVVCGR